MGMNEGIRESVCVTTAVCSYLPEELWERIFKLLYGDCCAMKSLCVVSKQFLSITNSLGFSLKITEQTIPFLSRLFRRFPNLISLNLILSCKRSVFDALLLQISTYPILSNIKSLSLSNPNTDIPTEGLRALSEKMKNLTSLTCSRMLYFGKNDIFFIADCFPLLEELNLNYPLFPMFSIFDLEIDSDQLLVLPKLRKINLYGNSMDSQTVVYLFKNCTLLQEVVHSMEKI